MTSHGVPRASTAPRTAQAIEEDRVKIDAYNALVGEVQGLKASKTYTKASLLSTSSLLEQNPEFNTIWNFRRRIVLHLLTSPEEVAQSEGTEEEKEEKEKEENKLSLLSSELTFLLPLLQKFPKCYWIWNYRLFILQTASEKLSLVTALKLWKAEMGLVNKMLSRDSRNFHGWGYRRYLVQSIEKLQEQQRSEEKEEKSSGKDDDEEESLVEQEFAYTTAMYGKDLSNFSAWHNRSKLIPRMLTERGATLEERITFLDGELGEMQTAVYTDPYDQSIQLYNHWLLLESCSPNSSPSDTSEVFPLATDQKSETLLRTLDWMRELLEEEPECRLLLEEMIFVGGLLRAVGGGDVDDEGVRADMQAWLEKLMEVDPMRGGRWREMKDKL
ncbi:Rab geranylgeranyltransferase [Orbilia blumenaviensis]|uniref:Geranylgeranyl transferase type-2 subunit alpha n=1 Tax=Orbilia blumenaviensis TaxID=1796055 RepID=A0AAV9VF14_9PEZI